VIYFKRSQPAPASLKKEKAKKNGSYKCGDVLERLHQDFARKCYLCEQLKPVTLNVEHLRAHRGDIERKFDWNNLFLSCGHCNNTKGAQYDQILDCTDPEQPVEKWIRHHMKPFPKERASFTAMHADHPGVGTTVDLLEAIYNGTTHLKRLEASNLREALLHEILEFQKHLLAFDDDQIEEDEKERAMREIKRHLSHRSAFTTFKRWIIRENEYLRKTFGRFLP
jgi:hypothetical protein